MAKPTPAKATMALAWLDIAPAFEGVVAAGGVAVPVPVPPGAETGLLAPVPVAAGGAVVAAAVVPGAVVGSAAMATEAMTARMATAENFMVGGSGLVGVGVGVGWLVWKWNEVRKRVKSWFVEKKKNLMQKTPILLYFFFRVSSCPIMNPVWLMSPCDEGDIAPGEEIGDISQAKK